MVPPTGLICYCAGDRANSLEAAVAAVFVFSRSTAMAQQDPIEHPGRDESLDLRSGRQSCYRLGMAGHRGATPEGRGRET